MIKKYYGDKDGLLVLSYNGIFTHIHSNRTYGKTWTFKKRSFRRALKHGKKTLWLRMFRKELKECADTFYSSRNLQKYCGLSVYDKKSNPKGNLRRDGYTFYYRRNENKPWRWFLKIFAVSDPDAVRSADDVDVDTIVFDEYTKTAEKLRRYRGNVVNDFIDIWVSAKRTHAVRCILIGNKEGYNNPFFNYFGIKPPAEDWEGIRSYRGGSLVIQQINNLPSMDTEFDRKTALLLEGTAYGNYLYKSRYKASRGIKPRKTPSTATLYVQVIIKSNRLRISYLDGFFYVNQKLDHTRLVYCDVLPNKGRHERLLIKRLKPYFADFLSALSDNRVYCDSEATNEGLQAFAQWLGA